MRIGNIVRPVLGTWPCGCDDTLGEVTDLDEVDGEPMAFVGTPCGWQWFPIDDLTGCEPDVSES